LKNVIKRLRIAGKCEFPAIIIWKNVIFRAIFREKTWKALEIKDFHVMLTKIYRSELNSATVMSGVRTELILFLGFARFF